MADDRNVHRYRRPHQGALIDNSLRQAAVMERMGREGDAQVVRDLANELRFVLEAADTAVAAVALSAGKRLAAAQKQLDALKAERGAETPTGA